MAVTVKSRAKAYAVAIELRKARHDRIALTGNETLEPSAVVAISKRAKVTPSLLALARINLQRELRRKLRNATIDRLALAEDCA